LQEIKHYNPSRSCEAMDFVLHCPAVRQIGCASRVMHRGGDRFMAWIRQGVVFIVWVAAAAWSHAAWQPLPTARNAIILIPDGCSHATVTLARWYAGRPLAVDGILTGSVRTHSATGVLTDSAAAATAMATGFKTAAGALAVTPPPEAPFRTAGTPPEAWHPLATVLESARLRGLAVGLVVTASPAEATPAGFAAHAVSRTADDAIMMQIVHQGFAVVLGGGRDALLPRAAGGSRRDGADLRAVLRARGYTVVETREQLAAARGPRVWGAFAAGDLAPQADIAETHSGQPSLAEMTLQALVILRDAPAGFVLVVEGSLIDGCGHDNDAIGAVTEFLAFDDAVRVALAFAAEDRHTLVVGCADHDTGGLTIGRRPPLATAATRDTLVAPLRQMRLTARGIEQKIGADTSRATLAAHVRAWWGITLTPAQADELDQLVNIQRYRPARAIGDVVSRHHLAVAWAGFDHTGADVPLWSYGPGRLVGNHDNTAIGRAVAAALRLDLDAATGELFVDAATLDPRAVIDSGASGGAALRLGRAVIPFNRDILRLDGREHRLGGVVVHIAETGKTYLPRLKPALLKRALRP